MSKHRILRKPGASIGPDARCSSGVSDLIDIAHQRWITCTFTDDVVALLHQTVMMQLQRKTTWVQIMMVPSLARRDTRKELQHLRWKHIYIDSELIKGRSNTN